jgi:[protein-PII] uridylyltransferase
MDGLARELGEGPEDGRAARIRGFVNEARAAAAARLEAGAAGTEVCAVFSDALDGLVRSLATALGASDDVALLATGGWGRRETCPYSDLDILFLVRREPGDAERALAERFLYPLWDAGLEVGHAVRSLDEAVRLAGDDLATMTALLDARQLAGDPGVGAALHEALHRELVRRGDPNLFVDKLGAEKHSRHARFGESVFLLEPNLKHGQGALRDLATGLWAARARWRVHDFADLPPLGQASMRQAGALIEAREFLLRVRCAMHLAARRRQDQLTFELQEALAPRFYPNARVREGEARPAVAPAVEELMRRYYLHARAVVRETDRLLDRARIPPRKPPIIRALDRTFIAFNGQVALRDPDTLREQPGEIVRLFRVALEQRLPIYGHTLDLVAELVAADPGRVGADPEARRHFVALLADARDDRQPSLLEQMNDLGLLAAMMPEFGPCRGRVQHDLYHVYTVDQHQLYAVALLKRLARGELSREAPEATAAVKQVERPEALYLGTLLHDVGKPLGKGHAEKGARLAQAIARRLGLSDEDVHQAEFLVQKHLIMSHLSQRRDLNDVSLVAGFAETMRDEETLRELYLLTYCDTSMTAPGNMTEWKSRLLAELYEKTRAFFKRGPDLSGADRSALVQRRRRRVAELLGERVDEEPLASWLAAVPDRYFAALEPRVIARHVKLSRARGARAAAIDVIHHPRKGHSELLVAAGDVPGLLARVTGVLVANRVDVVGATIASRASIADGGAAEALDVFLVRDRAGRAIEAKDPRWTRVEDDLGRVLGGGEDVRALVEARREKGLSIRRVTPEVPTEIEVDNGVAQDFTVLDVFTQDRPGVLFAITRTLSELGLDIALSKVATEADRVADVFYVRDRETGEKITSPERLEAITRALREALQAVQR